MRSSISKTGLFWFVIIAMILFMVLALPMNKPASDVLNYSDFVQKVEEGEISEVKVRGQQITGKLANNSNFKTTGPEDATVTLATLAANDVPTEIEEVQDSSLWYTALFTFVPLIVLVFAFMWFMRQIQGNNGRAMNFGKSKARMQGEGDKRVTFEDVAGIEESKEELAEIVDFLQDPQKFTRLGGRIPKGVLLMGSPGTGKTLLARAVAGEAGVPFFSISGSDFVEMFVGVGASRVRDLFEQGKKHAPCIIFIDEIDAVGRHRGAGMGGGHDEREQTLNALLVEMDGFEGTEGVIIVAATNRPDVLDPALLRPGRFDRRIVVANPDVRGRNKILEIHTRKLPLNDDVDLQVIAKGTPGFSGADLENLCNEAALWAARQDKTQVDHGDFLAAREKITLGPERRSMVMPEWEKRNTAYHEAGHAIVAHLLPDYDPVHKVTIVPRGRALGVTWTLPDEDRISQTRTSMHKQITMALGGRAAEEVAMKSMTGGAYSDIKTATAIARRMVCDLGMSDDLGPVSWGEGNSDPFLGRQMTRMQSYSEHTARRIDEEVRGILTRANDAAKGILQNNIHVLHAVADALLEQESLDGDEFAALVDAAGPVPPTGMQWMGVT